MDTRLSKKFLLRVSAICLFIAASCSQVNPISAITTTTRKNCAYSDIQKYIEELQSFKPYNGYGYDNSNENYDGSVNVEAYKMLVACGESAVPHLLDELILTGMVALNMDSYNALILSLLTEIGSDAVPKLVEIIQNLDDYQQRATVALGSIGSEALSETSDIIPLLVQNLRKYGSVEQYALSEMGSEAVPALIQLLQSDANLKERRLIAVPLGNIGPSASEATPLLLEILKTSPNEENDGQVLIALSKIGTASSSVVPLTLEAIEAGGFKFIKNPDGSIDNYGSAILATKTLSYYGALAKDAAPVLGNMLEAKATEADFLSFLPLCYAATALVLCQG